MDMLCQASGIVVPLASIPPTANILFLGSCVLTSLCTNQAADCLHYLDLFSIEFSFMCFLRSELRCFPRLGLNFDFLSCKSVDLGVCRSLALRPSLRRRLHHSQSWPQPTRASPSSSLEISKRCAAFAFCQEHHYHAGV